MSPPDLKQASFFSKSTMLRLIVVVIAVADSGSAWQVLVSDTTVVSTIRTDCNHNY